MNFKKIKLSIVAFFTILALILVFTPNSVSAAAQGTTMQDPINIVFGSQYAKSWSSYSDHLYCYNKVNVINKGILKMNFTKPFDAEGEYGRLEVIVYDSTGNPIWDSETYYGVKSASPSYTFYVGLDKGTYYVAVTPKFYVSSGIITTNYSFTFANNNYTEVEPNETPATATSLNFNKMYQAYSGRDFGDYDNNDYYKVNLTKGYKYKLIIENLDKLPSSFIYLYSPNGQKESLSSRYDFAGIDSNGNKYYEFIPNITGTYYIQIESRLDAQVPYKIGVYDPRPDLAKATVTLGASSYVYTGNAIKTSVTVKYNGKTLKNGTDYTVSYSNNKNIGTATVKVTGKGKYMGSVSKKFKIVLAQIKGVSASSQTTSAITLRWNKVSAVDGYQVDMATSKNGTYKRVGAPNSATRNYLTKSNLTPGKTYYFKVRSYKTINGKKYYSPYSTILSTSTKPNTSVISSLTSTSKKAKITWKKDTSVTGYEVYMATSKNGSYSRIYAPARNTTVSYTKSNLTSGKTYYFKVRSYKTVDGKKIYSNFSTIKYVKVK